MNNYYELKMFQSDGESSREPLVKGAGLQLTVFPDFAPPWALI